MVSAQLKGDSLSPFQFSLERFMFFVGLINPAFLIPQIIKIYFTHTHLVGGVSAIAFAGFAISWFCWLYYGLVFNRWALVSSSLLSTIGNALVCVGCIIYTVN